MPLLALPTSTRRCREPVLEAEVVERCLAGIHPEVHRTAAATIPAIGAAPGDVGLVAHRGRAVATGAGAHGDPDIV
jgi:hypothetical protein